MNTRKKIGPLIGGAAVLAAAAIGLTAGNASAEKIWDIGANDACAKKADSRFMNGVTNWAQYTEELKWCCISSGGELSPTQGCTAPAALTQAPDPAPTTPPQVANGSLPTEATGAPAGPAPGSNAPGGCVAWHSLTVIEPTRCGLSNRSGSAETPPHRVWTPNDLSMTGPDGPPTLRRKQ